MTRTIERFYSFSDTDVREAILCWLHSKDVLRPGYITNVTKEKESTQWGFDNGKITLRWIEILEVEP